MLNFVENSKNIKFLLFFGICFMLLAMPINAETVTLTTDIYRDMQYSKNNPLTISNGDISLNNSKMTMYANLKNSLSNSLINLSQTFINIDYTIKDYGYYRKWSLNLTKPSLTAYNIQDIGFYFSNCKKYSENILHCDGIELDFSDLAEDFTINMNDFNMTISNEKLLNKSNIFLDPTDQLIPNATNKAYANTTATTSATAWLFGSSNEFSSTQYNQVNTSDNVRFSQILNQYTTTRYNYYKFTFNLTAAGININDVTQIVLYHEGFYETSFDSVSSLYYYNTTAGAWTLWAGMTKNVDTIDTKTITNPSSIINSTSGLVQFGVRLMTMRFFGEVSSYTDFAYINVTTSAGDTTSPTSSNCFNNVTNNTVIATGIPIALGCQWNDNVALSMYVNSSKINNSGSWTNGTWSAFSSGNWSNYTIIFPSEQDSNLTVKIYANDTSNNQNITGTWFWWNNTAPSDTCTYSGSGDWYININDNCTLSTTNTVSGNMYVYGSNGYLIFLANQLAYAYYVNATGSWNWYYNSYRILY